MTVGGTADGRVWLVTGATSGFGRAIVTAALARGDTVVGAARSEEALAELAAGEPERFRAVRLDVTDPATVPATVAETIGRFGRIDVLVNAAGRGHVGAVEETTEAELRDLMELHFFGPVALVREVLPHMRERRSGTVVQITSVGGRLAFAGVGAYAASKFALEGLTEALAAEVAPSGIRTLMVEPGSFRTRVNHPSAFTVSAASPAYEETVAPVREVQAASDGHQPGDPDKAAAAILAALDADEPPRRLVLGNDAADAVGAHLDADRAEFDAWEQVSRGTDLAG